MTRRPMPPSASGLGLPGTSVDVHGRRDQRRPRVHELRLVGGIGEVGIGVEQCDHRHDAFPCCSMSTMTPRASLAVTMSGRHVTLHRIARPRRLVASSTTSWPPVLAGQAVADRPAQLLDRQADVEVEQVLAAHLVGAQAPQLLGLAVPDLDAQLAVEHGDADARGWRGSTRGTR